MYTVFIICYYLVLILMYYNALVLYEPSLSSNVSESIFYHKSVIFAILAS